MPLNKVSVTDFIQFFTNETLVISHKYTRKADRHMCDLGIIFHICSDYLPAYRMVLKISLVSTQHSM